MFAFATFYQDSFFHGALFSRALYARFDLTPAISCRMMNFGYNYFFRDPLAPRPASLIVMLGILALGFFRTLTLCQFFVFLKSLFSQFNSMNSFGIIFVAIDQTVATNFWTRNNMNVS